MQLGVEFRERFLGKNINSAKLKIEDMLTLRKSAILNIETQNRLSEESIDVTLPPRGLNFGAIHPVTRVIRRVEDIFKSIGFDK